MQCVTLWTLPDNIGFIDNNGQYYSFVKTILMRSLNARAIAAVRRPHHNSDALEEI